MSLLLDALKKVGQSRQGAGQEGAPGPTELARTASQKLFAAKAAPARRKLGIIPTALISGFLIAAGGGYYVWREISPRPQMYYQDTKVAGASAHAPANTEYKPASKNAQSEAAQETPAKSATTIASVKAPRSSTLSTPSSRTTGDPAPSLRTQERLHVVRTNSGEVVDPTLLAAWQAYRDSDFATAWQLYRTVLQQDGKNRDALLGMAAIARQQGRDDVAAQYYGHVLTLDPRDPTAHAGMSTLASGDATSTESKLKLQLAYRPDSAMLHFALANLYAEQSRWSEASLAYLNAYKRNPEDAQLAYNLAVSFDHLGQNKQAVEYYKRALQLDRSTASGINREQVQQRVNELPASWDSFKNSAPSASTP